MDGEPPEFKLLVRVLIVAGLVAAVAWLLVLCVAAAAMGAP